MKNTICKITVFLVFISSGLFADAQALVTIEIDQGVNRGVPIAVVPFAMPEDVALDYAVDNVIRADLARTGKFNTIDPLNFLSYPTAVSDVNFEDWKLIGADYLLIGTVSRAGGGYQVETRLYATFEGKQVIGYQFQADEELQLRATAHDIANRVFEAVTGGKSSFESRILYTTNAVAASGQLEHRIYLSDYDGYNPQLILTETAPILSPTWSPDSEQIAYAILRSTGTELFVQSVATGTRRQLVRSKWNISAPRWSPDGERIAMAGTYEGNTDVLLYSIRQGKLAQVTEHAQIDTEPAWSPDGEFIVFTSNRGRGTQIYRARVDQVPHGLEFERITREGNFNGGAQYSPSGEQLALISDADSGKQVALLDLKTLLLTVLSDTKLDESVNFSPNGEMLMYVVEGRDRHISTLSLDGEVKSRIPIPDTAGQVKQVAWESKQ